MLADGGFLLFRRAPGPVSYTGELVLESKIPVTGENMGVGRDLSHSTAGRAFSPQHPVWSPECCQGSPRASLDAAQNPRAQSPQTAPGFA